MDYTVGEIYEGKVKTITNFGAFVTLPGNRTGMVHISEIAYSYVSDIHQVLTEGQDVKVMVTAVDPAGKINLSIKRAQPQPERQERAPRAPRQDSRGPRPAEQNESTAESSPRPVYANRSANRDSVPAQNRSAGRQPEVYTPAASNDQSFEDKLKKFMSQSESRLADAKQYEYRNKGRRR